MRLSLAFAMVAKQTEFASERMGFIIPCQSLGMTGRAQLCACADGTRKSAARLGRVLVLLAHAA